MSQELLKESIAQQIIRDTKLPTDWHACFEDHPESDRRSFPQEQPMAGTVLLMGWAHDDRDEEVIVGMCWGEDEPYGVDVTSNGGTYHAHSCKTLSEAQQAASMAAYMLNHFSHGHTEDKSLSVKVDHMEDLIDELRDDKDNLQSQVDTYKDRAEELQSKNQMLRSQMNSLIDLQASGYEDGEWHGMVQQAQHWRPPYYSELKELAIFIDKFWYDCEAETIEGVSKHVKDELASAYLVVLDNYNPVMTDTKDKALFYFSGTAGVYTMFYWKNNDNCLIEVPQRPAVGHTREAHGRMYRFSDAE